MPAPLDFSVSHSGDLVGLAVATSQGGDRRSRAVGLDVERIAPVADGAAPDIVLSPAERDAFDPLEAAAQIPAFFRYWVRKEAVLKATGEGLAVPMTHLTVSRPDQPPRLAEWQGRPAFPACVSLHDLTARSGYAAALALVGRDVAVVERDAAGLISEAQLLTA